MSELSRVRLRHFQILDRAQVRRLAIAETAEGQVAICPDSSRRLDDRGIAVAANQPDPLPRRISGSTIRSTPGIRRTALGQPFVTSLRLRLFDLFAAFAENFPTGHLLSGTVGGRGLLASA